MARCCLLILLALVAATAPAEAAERLTARVDASGRATITGSGGAVLVGRALEVRRHGRWMGAEPGAAVRVRVSRPGEGLARVRVSAPGADGVRLTFATRAGERYLGFGERSNAVDQRGRTVEALVEEGPYLERDYDLVSGSVPPWALRRASDASSFPMPWLLSTRGYGVLVDQDDASRFRLGSARADRWSVEADAPVLDLLAMAGPAPADVLRRLTRVTGRQPAAPAAWQWGPWVQTGHADTAPGEREALRDLREAGAPFSVVETHMRYLPCGADRGREESERARVQALHGTGAAALTYVREAVCADDRATFDEGVRRGAFTRRADGTPYTYDAFVGGRVTAVAQIDFTRPEGEAFWATLLKRPLANGYDGWMEDYGEYTPLDAVGGGGLTGTAHRNAYPRAYHRAGRRIAAQQERPVLRFVRSGWTGTHPHASVVWGGDPSTVWGFDGLRSAVAQALTMGLSGISTWGSDIGGFFSLTGARLDAELLTRWVQLGAVSGVMRTKAEGIGQPLAERPQVWDPALRPLWRRYASLRTRLYPYIAAADAEYRRTGLPLMRHGALVAPGDPAAVRADDVFGFGPDLLAAPVLEPGARRRRAHLPPGRWVDLWRAVAYDEATRELRLGRATARAGGRTADLPAPLDELPLLARAGTLLPLLPASVDTLADAYDTDAVTALAEVRNDLEVLAFPRGDSSAAVGTGGTLRSREGRERWTFSLEAPESRRVVLQASLRTLERPLTPLRVLLDGRVLRRSAWSYDAATGVLRARFAGRRATLTVLGA